MIESINADNANKENKININDSYRSNYIGTRTYPYILLFLVFLIFSRRDKHGIHLGDSKEQGLDLMQIIKSAIKHPEMERVLGSVCNHLEYDQQGPIHTVAGLLQLINTTKKIKENSYRIPGVPNSLMTLNNGEKHMSIIRELKEFANDEDRNVLEAIESTFTAMSKIQRAVGSIDNKDNRNELKDDIIEVIESTEDAMVK